MCRGPKGTHKGRCCALVPHGHRFVVSVPQAPSGRKGVGIILDAASGEMGVTDTATVYRTMNVLCSLIIPPSSVVHADYHETWQLVRSHGGIRILLSILEWRHHDASLCDAIRAAVCKAFLAMSTEIRIKQVWRGPSPPSLRALHILYPPPALPLANTQPSPPLGPSADGGGGGTQERQQTGGGAT